VTGRRQNIDKVYRSCNERDFCPRSKQYSYIQKHIKVRILFELFCYTQIMKRIVVIGKSGAGKTTFSSELSKELDIEVIHLDDLFWKSGWERVYTADEWEKKVKELIAQEEWILDGNYHNTLDVRLARADTVIFFDIHPFIALAQALKRRFFDTSEDGMDIHQKPSLRKMIRTIITFPTKDIYKKIKHSGVNNIYIIKSRKDARKLLVMINRPL